MPAPFSGAGFVHTHYHRAGRAPPEEYAAGHITGALSVLLDELRDRLAKLPAGQEIVAYCRSPRRQRLTALRFGFDRGEAFDHAGLDPLALLDDEPGLLHEGSGRRIW